MTEALAIARAVLAVGDVVALSSGPVGQFRTYLPDGSSVPGVRIDRDHVEVNVVSRYGPALLDLGTEVFAALGPHLGGRTVSVSVDDIVLPGEPDPEGADSVMEPAPGADPD